MESPLPKPAQKRSPSTMLRPLSPDSSSAKSLRMSLRQFRTAKVVTSRDKREQRMVLFHTCLELQGVDPNLIAVDVNFGEIVKKLSKGKLSPEKAAVVTREAINEGLIYYEDGKS